MFFRRLILLLLFASLTACQSSFGPSALRETHPAYNQVMVNSLNQQMLLNLVRLKYYDTPYFLKIASVTATLSLGGNASMGGAANTSSSNNVATAGLGLNYSDQPTISYVPLQDGDFLKDILSPISLEALLMMTQSGWSIEAVFGVCLERINNHYNAPGASGPTPRNTPNYVEFKRSLELLQELQLTHKLEIGLAAASSGQPAELVLMIKQGSTSLEKNAALAGLLDYEYTDNENVFITVSTDFLEKNPNEISIRTRSIASVLFYLSQNIDIPQEHIEAGLITTTRNPDGSIFNWGSTPAGSIFNIRSSKTYPQHAYLVVPYRDYWFYIADNDLQTKSTFLLLTQLFNLQAGQNDYSGPTLTLPVR
ncbi:MAG: hypothetical protein L3J22_04120 [Xanthomonadales bacterium]|nr:hypothetical protein [Xanthomonadales bacterium]